MKLTKEIKDALVKSLKEGGCVNPVLLFHLKFINPVVVFACEKIREDATRNGHTYHLEGYNTTLDIDGQYYNAILLNNTFNDLAIMKTLIHESLHAAVNALDPSREHIFKSDDGEEVFVTGATELLWDILRESLEHYNLRKLLKESV